MPGRVYSDEVTVLGQDVQETGVVIRPTAVADDPARGIYTSWPAAHAAVVLLDVPLRQIWIDSPGVAVPIPPSPGPSWDMDRIAIVGFPTPAGGLPSGLQTVATLPGCFFINFTEGTQNCILDHLGLAPLFSVVVLAPNALIIRTGRNARWRSGGNVAPVVSLSGTGGLIVDVEEGTVIEGGGAVFAVFELIAAPAEYEFRLYDNTDLQFDTLVGPDPGSTINRLFVGIGPVIAAQPGFAGTLADFLGADNLTYFASPASWVPPAPLTVDAALDRIAAIVVAGAPGGPIP